MSWGRAFHSCEAEQANDPLYSDVLALGMYNDPLSVDLKFSE